MKMITILMSLMISTFTFAGLGGGHGHSHAPAKKTKQINAEKAETLARNKVRVLAFQEKINESWNEAELESAEIKKGEDKKEWLVTLTNEKGVKGKKLYIFLKLDGEFVAANFTGK
jgi:hypothetical protein